MNKILIECKGLPTIIEHNHKGEVKVKYVAVCKTTDSKFRKMYFESLDSAIDYHIGNYFMLFVELILDKSLNSKSNDIYFVVYEKNKLTCNKKISINKETLSSIYFYFDNKTICVRKLDNKISKKVTYSLFQNYDRFHDEILNLYSKNVINKTNNKFIYDFIPEFSDLCFEIFFIYDVINSNFSKIQNNTLDAYLLQAKNNYGHLDKEMPDKVDFSKYEAVIKLSFFDKIIKKVKSFFSV